MDELPFARQAKGLNSCAAIQMAKLSGFSPIITTATPHNEGYCKAAGATHVIDYTKVPYGPAFADAVASITTAPIKVIWDCIAHEDSQLACWSILAPSGTLVEAFPTPSPKIGEDGFVDKDGRKVVGVFRSAYFDAEGGENRLGKTMFAALESMLRDGDLKPTRVDLLPGGLLGVADGLKRVMSGSGKVSGQKLVVSLADTPQ